MRGMIPKAKIFLKKHSPTILTCVGAAGVIATAVTAVAATPKAMRLMQEKEEEKGEKLTKMEVVKTAGPAYIPSAIICASTLGCIFGANVLNKKRQASLASAYALLDSSYKEYRNAVRTVYDEEGEKKVIQAMVEQKEPLEDEDGKVLVFDNFTMQFFRAKLEDIQKAKTQIAETYKTRGYACFQEFYEAIGIDYLDPDYQFGWSAVDGQYLYGHDTIEIKCEPTMNEKGEIYCYILSMLFEPYEGYLL